jgi:tRNA threonylcarbamoyladenosine biosynthesis protein TsaE
MATTISNSAEETMAFGQAFARAARNGGVFALDGDLGAGKTHFVKGFVSALGYREAVTSPTFTLVHEYPCQPWPVFHFDFYRLDSAEEALALDFDGYLGRDGIVLVEWASKFPGIFPAGTRWLRFQIGEGDERQIVEETAP